MLKAIPLQPFSASWTGSELPIIDKLIKRLESLKDRFKGIDFLEHRDYIDNVIKEMERKREDIEIREYMENIV